MISILPYGDTALLVNFEQCIDRKVHEQVLALHDALTDVPGLRFMIPAYCSLTIVYDPLIAKTSVLEETIRERMALASKKERDALQEAQHHSIPVCYDNAFGPDLEEVHHQTGKSIDEIITTHSTTEFYVYMLGFMPGFAYMGDMPEAFRCSRQTTPRTRVPSGSVGLAGTQTAIYPFESPGGWQIIGRTPAKLFDLSREPAALVKAGDTVRFSRISRADYDRMQ